jgi:hypothetical protein
MSLETISHFEKIFTHIPAGNRIIYYFGLALKSGASGSAANGSPSGWKRFQIPPENRAECARGESREVAREGVRRGVEQVR